MTIATMTYQMGTLRCCSWKWIITRVNKSSVLTILPPPYQQLRSTTHKSVTNPYVKILLNMPSLTIILIITHTIHSITLLAIDIH